MSAGRGSEIDNLTGAMSTFLVRSEYILRPCRTRTARTAPSYIACLKEPVRGSHLRTAHGAARILGRQNTVRVRYITKPPFSLNLEVGEALAREHGLRHDAREGEHGQPAVLELLELHLRVVRAADLERPAVERGVAKREEPGA